MARIYVIQVRFSCENWSIYQRLELRHSYLKRIAHLSPTGIRRKLTPVAAPELPRACFHERRRRTPHGWVNDDDDDRSSPANQNTSLSWLLLPFYSSFSSYYHDNNMQTFEVFLWQNLPRFFQDKVIDRTWLVGIQHAASTSQRTPGRQVRLAPLVERIF